MGLIEGKNTMAHNIGTASSFRWYILTALAISLGSAFMNITCFAPLLLPISEDMNISMASATALMSSIYLASAIAFIFFAGQLVDRMGVKRTMILGTALAGGSAVLVPLIASSYAIIFALRMIQGGAMAIAFVCLAPALRAYFPKKEYGLSGGLMGGSMSFCAAITLLLTPHVFHAIGQWPLTVALFSIPSWIGILLMLFVPNSSNISEEEIPEPMAGQEEIGYFQVFKYPITWLGIGALFFAVWALRAIESLAPTYLAADAPLGIGLGDITAGYFTFGLTMAGLMGVIVGGLLLDRVAHGNYRLIMMAGLSIFAVFTFLITVPVIYGSYPLLMICIILAGMGVPFVKACGGPFIINVYPPRLIGRISGLMTGLGSIGASGGIWLAGKLADRTGRFSSAMILLALVGAAGCILSYFLKQELRVGNHSIAATGNIDNPKKAPAAN